MDKELEAAVEYIEELLWGYDWIGTGSSYDTAGEREAWEKWNIIRKALGLEEADI